MSEDEYIKEGDIILVDSRDDNSITEVKITDISPSGEYIEVRVDQYNSPFWLHSNRHLETLKSEDADDSEYVDVDDDDLIGDEWREDSVHAQDILAKIRNRAGATLEFDPDEKIEAEVITHDTMAKFDARNKRK